MLRYTRHDLMDDLQYHNQPKHLAARLVQVN